MGCPDLVPTGGRSGSCSGLGVYPKLGSSKTVHDPAHPAMSPLFNKGSIDPGGEKASFPGENVGFCPGGWSVLVSREMLI